MCIPIYVVQYTSDFSTLSCNVGNTVPCFRLLLLTSEMSGYTEDHFSVTLSFILTDKIIKIRHKLFFVSITASYKRLPWKAFIYHHLFHYMCSFLTAKDDPQECICISSFLTSGLINTADIHLHLQPEGRGPGPPTSAALCATPPSLSSSFFMPL